MPFIEFIAEAKGPLLAQGAMPQSLEKSASPVFSGMELGNPGNGTGTTLVRTLNGQLKDLTSTRETKENIRPLAKVIDPSVLRRLEPVAFNYKGQDPDEELAFGFIAEDVAAVAPELVLFREGMPYSIQYGEFAPLIVAAMNAEASKRFEFDSEVAERLSTHNLQLSELSDQVDARDALTEQHSTKLLNVDEHLSELGTSLTSLDAYFKGKLTEFADRQGETVDLVKGTRGELSVLSRMTETRVQDVLNRIAQMNAKQLTLSDESKEQQNKISELQRKQAHLWISLITITLILMLCIGWVGMR